MRKVGCADAVPRTQKQVLRRRGEPYAARNGTSWFGEGGATRSCMTSCESQTHDISLEVLPSIFYQDTRLE